MASVFRSRARVLVEHPVWTIFIVGLAARLVTAAVVAVQFDGSVTPDDANYSRVAGEAARGEDATWDFQTNWRYERGFALYWPVTQLYRVFGEHEFFGQLYLVAAGAGAAALVVWLALQIVDRRLAIAAGAVVALLPSQILWSSVILKEAIVWVAMATVACCVVRLNLNPRARASLGWLALATACLVVVAYTRQQTAIIGAWCLLIGLAFGSRERLGFRIAVACAVALLLPSITTQYGLGGQGLLDAATGAEEQRERRAAGAESAIVPSTDEGGTTEDPTPADDEGENAGPADAALDPSAGGTLGDQLAYLPTGVAAYALRPYLWEAQSKSSTLRMAAYENLVWYPLWGLGLVGLAGLWRRRSVLAFPVAVLGATIVMYALSEGNLGTAFRHRGETLWGLSLLAAVGFHMVFSRWKSRRRSGDETEVT